jgi:hypothetical protein
MILLSQHHTRPPHSTMLHLTVIYFRKRYLYRITVWQLQNNKMLTMRKEAVTPQIEVLSLKFCETEENHVKGAGTHFRVEIRTCNLRTINRSSTAISRLWQESLKWFCQLVAQKSLLDSCKSVRPSAWKTALGYITATAWLLYNDTLHLPQICSLFLYDEWCTYTYITLVRMFVFFQVSD